MQPAISNRSSELVVRKSDTSSKPTEQPEGGAHPTSLLCGAHFVSKAREESGIDVYLLAAGGYSTQYLTGPASTHL